MYVQATSAQHVILRVNLTTGVLAYSLDNGTNYTNTSTTLVAGQVYALEMFVDFGTSTTRTLKIRLDGVEIVNTTGAQTATTSNGIIAFGAGGTAAAVVVDYADLATYNDVAQYGTIGADWRVHGLEPVSDGTHLTSADFQNQASASLSGTTTSWQLVDDAPTAAPSTTDFVKQVTAATAYLEWVLDAVPSTGYTAPLLVCLAAAVHPVGSALANSAQFRLRALNADATTSAEAVVDASTTQDVLEYRKHSYPARPVTAAAWALGDVTSAAPLRARFGYAGDISPPPACDAIMAFVLTPKTVSTTANLTDTLLSGTPSVGETEQFTRGMTDTLLSGTPSLTAVKGTNVTRNLTDTLLSGTPSLVETEQFTRPLSDTLIASAAATAAFVANVFSSIVTDTSGSTTITGTTSRAVAAGDTVFFVMGERGGTTNPITIALSGLPGDVSIEYLPWDHLGSPGVAIARVYFPTGMAISTAVTATWSQSATKKTMQGMEWSGVGNANVQGIGHTDGTSNPPDPTSGTTGATTTTGGVHVFAASYASTIGTLTATPGSDEEGAMTERVDTVLGASAFHYLYASDHPVAVAHAGGMTAGLVASANNIASWAGVQGVWAGGVGVSDSIVPTFTAGGTTFSRPITDTLLTPSDSVVRTLAAPRALADTLLSGSPSLARTLVAPRSITDQLVTPSDSILRTLAAPRPLTDTLLTPSDSILRTLLAPRNITDTLLSGA
jgi:hypothetical protein